jgi:aminoglycoside phosphotransferase (APT) family kinase protein
MTSEPMNEVIELREDLRQALEATGEPGSAELCDALDELLDGADPSEGVGLRRLKARVYRLETGGRASRRTVVVKRLEPAAAQQSRLVAERWLPALGLGDRCARLLAVAADRRGENVWHVYEDLGDDTLAARPALERAEAAVDLVAELHTRAACHAVLPDARRSCRDLGMPYFVSNVRDAIAALEALAASGIETPPEHAGLPGRLRERLIDLLADAPRRARAFERAAGPDTLLHGDLWTINIFVSGSAEGPRARLVDWERVGVGPFSYDLSTFLFRFPAAQRPWILDRYRHAVSRAGWRLASPPELDLLFDTAERARYANRVVWPVLALLHEHAAWGFPELAEVERWFQALEGLP